MTTVQPSLWERALKILSPSELETLIEYLEAVKEDGFGDVSVEFENHHPAKIKIRGRISRLLINLKQKNYKPE